jgi:hypothetical protein
MVTATPQVKPTVTAWGIWRINDPSFTTPARTSMSQREGRKTGIQRIMSIVGVADRAWEYPLPAEELDDAVIARVRIRWCCCV